MRFLCILAVSQTSDVVPGTCWSHCSRFGVTGPDAPNGTEYVFILLFVCWDSLIYRCQSPLRVVGRPAAACLCGTLEAAMGAWRLHTWHRCSCTPAQPLGCASHCTPSQLASNISLLCAESLGHFWTVCMGDTVSGLLPLWMWCLEDALVLL